jgi:alpha-tubulin suppressor-like RCC1 family protein
MKNSRVFTLAMVALLCSLLLNSCKDGGNSTPNPEITSIAPTVGPVGTTINIEGSGFGSSASEIEVSFNGTAAEITSVSDSRIQTIGSSASEIEDNFKGTAAEITSVSDTLIQTSVPEGATSGAVQVSVGGVTAQGPAFTVEPTMPGIQSVRPDSGEVGRVVTITGMNFGGTPSENSVTFNGTEAIVDSANANRIKTRVPQGATSGPVEVTVAGATATGSSFKVLNVTGTLKVLVRTTGDNRDPDGYTVRVDGNVIRTGVRDTLTVRDLALGTHSVRLSGVASNCSVSGTNPREVSITARTTTSTTFEISCTKGMPSIQSVRPDSGEVGRVVTITGMNFGGTPSENSVTFNGTEAIVDSANANRIKTRVPQGATSGPVEVTVAGATATGSSFKVLNVTGTLKVLVRTTGDNRDPDGYTVRVDGNVIRTGVRDTLTVRDLALGTHSVRLSGVASNCSVSGTNPREVSITARTTTSTTFEISCTEENPGTTSIFTTVSAGRDHSCGISTLGDAYCWGNNEFGQLGNGEVGVGLQKNLPFKVNMPAGVSFTAISTGFRHTIAITSSGKAYAWGLNTLGQLGDGSTTNRLAPVEVNMPSGVSFSKISSGVQHTVAITADGKGYAWGRNNLGQLGVGNTTNSSTPVAVSMPAGVTFTAVDAGDRYNIALSSTGQAYAWGANFFGKLGDGTTTNRQAPVAVIMPSSVKFTRVTASSGAISMAVSAGGQAYGWGLNNFGQLGDGTTTNQESPVPVDMPAGINFVDIDTGENHTIAITSAGRAYAWGANGSGQLGNGMFIRQSMPRPVFGGTDFSEISAGNVHNLALDANGQGYAWGENLDGELGDGTFARRTSVVKVGGN